MADEPPSLPFLSGPSVKLPPASSALPGPALGPVAGLGAQTLGSVRQNGGPGVFGAGGATAQARGLQQPPAPPLSASQPGLRAQVPPPLLSPQVSAPRRPPAWPGARTVCGVGVPAPSPAWRGSRLRRRCRHTRVEVREERATGGVSPPLSPDRLEDGGQADLPIEGPPVLYVTHAHACEQRVSKAETGVRRAAPATHGFWSRPRSLRTRSTSCRSGSTRVINSPLWP